MNIRRVAVLRPGALGDVLVTRHLLAALRTAFPEAELLLAAPGERGKLLSRFGLADRALDWESAAFSWLFSGTNAPPPEPLRPLAEPDTLVLAFLDLPDSEARTLRASLGAQTVFSPSRPPADANEYIGSWLIRQADLAAVADNVPPSGDFVVDREPEPRTLAVHPGSGSAGKNYPLPAFAELIRHVLAGGAFTLVRVLSGPADGTLGRDLAGLLAAFPAHGREFTAELLPERPLAELTGVLASAALYLGNDSGVTHLASAAKTLSGRKPSVAAVFRSSAPAVWAAPGTFVLRADVPPSDLAKKILSSRVLP